MSAADQEKAFQKTVHKYNILCERENHLAQEQCELFETYTSEMAHLTEHAQNVKKEMQDIVQQMFKAGLLPRFLDETKNTSQ